MIWNVHHRGETASTNADARQGRPGDVYTADFQTAGRGRLDHKWLSPRGANLMMSAVLSVEGLSPEHVSTVPLVVGLAVVRAVKAAVGEGVPVSLKWPNDVYVEGRKVAGILCERCDDRVIAGIGVNVLQTEFPCEIAARATSVVQAARGTFAGGVGTVRDLVLGELSGLYDLWREQGFAAVHSAIAAVDYLKGRHVAIRQTDEDAEPVSGLSGGILSDGSLEVGGVRVYAGEAHVESL